MLGLRKVGGAGGTASTEGNVGTGGTVGTRVTSSATARTYAKPWVSKFHPVHWDDLVGNDEAVYILRTMIDHAAVPHLILAGPPGVGKSSAITCFVRQFYPDAAQRRTAVLEINAAEENKQDVFIDKIPTFIKRARQLPDDRRAIVVLEEAENLSENAQRNLWVCMRRYANVIFVLTGNDMERLKPYILGRCCRLAFGPIRAEQLKARCGQVLDRLGVAYKASALDALCQVANGDLRRAMNLVQMAAQSVQSVQSMPASETTPEATKSTSGMELDGDQVYRLTWGLTVDDVVAWLQSIFNLSFTDTWRRVQAWLLRGCTPLDLVQSFGVVLRHEAARIFNTATVCRALDASAETKRRMVLDNGGTPLQLAAFVASLYRFIHFPNDKAPA